MKLFKDHDSKCVNVERNDGLTPLHVACSYRRYDMIKVLLENGARIDGQCKNGKTPLQSLIGFNTNLKLVKLLLSFKPDVNLKDSEGQISLFKAVSCGNLEITQALIDHGSYVNSIANNGSTPLHAACIRLGSQIFKDPYIDIVKCLLKNKADTSARNHDGRTPVMHTFEREIPISHEALVFSLKYFNFNDVYLDGKNFLSCYQWDSTWKIFLLHFAKLQALDLLVHPSVLISISNYKDYKTYYEKSMNELSLAKSCKLKNSWITYFNLLVDGKKKLKNYAGNEDLIKDFKKRKFVRKFPLYGEQICKNLEKGVNRRKLYDVSSVLLSNCLLNLNPTHLIVRDILDCVSTKELSKLCE